MRLTLLIAALVVIAGCAATKPEVDKASVEDFIAVRELPEVDSIRTDSTDGWYELNNYYVIYQTRRGEFLFQFARRCWELDEQRVTPDQRWDANTVRARFDTLRGCRIDKIFGLTETDVTELKQLGDSPGEDD
jgi:hypothetical protein